MSTYATTKHAIRGLSFGVAEDLRSHHIKVSLISPGITHTPLGDQFESEFSPVSHLKAEEMLQPDDLADSLELILRMGPTATISEVCVDSQSAMLDHQEPARKIRSVEDLGNVECQIQDPTIIITGAGKGIGYTAALRFAREGYNVSAFDRDADSLKALEKDVRAIIPAAKLMTVVGDVTDESAVKQLVDQTVFRFGGISIVFSNAGVNRRCNVAHFDGDFLLNIVKTNLWGPMMLVKWSIPHLAAASAVGWNSNIIFTNSVVSTSETGIAGMGSYLSTKFGLHGYALSAFEDLRPLGIRVTSLLPGLTKTPLGNKPAPMKILEPQEMIQPEDVAEAAIYATRTRKGACPIWIEISPLENMYDSLKEYDRMISAR